MSSESNDKCIICGGEGRLMHNKESNANCPVCGSKIYLPPNVKDGDLMDVIHYSLEREDFEWLVKHKWIVIAFYLLVPLFFVAGLYFAPDAPGKLPGFSSLTDCCMTIGLPTLLYIVAFCWGCSLSLKESICWNILTTSLLAIALAAIIIIGNWYTSNHSRVAQPASITSTTNNPTTE